MEGIKEAIAYITGLAVKAEKPETIEINGRTYCTKDLRRYDAADKAEPIKATTLTSLVDYIKESREELRDRMIIQVVSATKVLLYSGLLALVAALLLFGVIGEKDGLRQQNITIAFVAVIVLIIALNRFF